MFKVKTLTRLSGLFLFFFSVNALAQSAIRINFAPNAISYDSSAMGAWPVVEPVTAPTTLLGQPA